MDEDVCRHSCLLPKNDAKKEKNASEV